MFAATGAKQKPVLDENTFQQLLAAAYTLQENNAALRSKKPRREAARIFSEINNVRARIMVDDHDFAAALTMVVDCLRKLTSADGASICLVSDGYLSCVACSGMAAKVPGGSVASNSLVATERLRNGRTFQSANARGDIRLEPAMCVELQIGSLVAVPIERNNEAAGLVELRWKDASAFEAWDERICELAVGLIGELLDREFGPVIAAAPVPDQAVAEGQRQKQNPHSFEYAQGEFCSPQDGETRMGHSILKLTPMNLEELREESEHGPRLAPVAPPAVPVSEVSTGAAANTCRVCGHALNAKDDFCGNCGMLAHSTDDGMQSKWASMLFMQRAQKTVDKGQSRAEHMWPLEGARAERATTVLTESSNLCNEEVEAEEAEPILDDAAQGVAGKRGPRSVLSALKSQLKARGMARKLSAVIFLALMKKISLT